jgi:hypothetical protein
MENGCDRRKDTMGHNEPVMGEVGRRRMREEMRGRHMHEDMCEHHMQDDMCERHMHEDMCEKDMCERHDGDFDRFPLAMCYVPWQCFRELYENEFAALANGTLFKELDLKWYGRGCK